MRIVVAGAGEVGRHLAKMLSFEHHDVIVIDADEERSRLAKMIGDVIVIDGSSTSIATLREANLKKTDLFIAVNPAENQDMNITSSLLAKQLGAKRVIARINNEEYLFPNNIEMFLNAGIDSLFYPERIASNEIIKMLGQTTFAEYVDFSGGKLQLIVLKIEEGVPIVGKPISNGMREGIPQQYRTIAIARDGKTIIPTGSEEYKENDTVYIIAHDTAVKDVLLFSGKTNIDVKDVMILGGGEIGVMVARELEQHINVKMLEIDRDRCSVLTEMLQNTLILNTDGRNTDFLIEEEVSKMDAFVAVTGSSETNIMACMAAKRMGVQKTIAEIENINYIKLAENIGVDTVVNKKLITASTIFRFAMSTDVQAIKYLSASDAEVLEYIAKPGSPSTKNRIGKLDFPKDAIIGGIIRGEQVFIANDESEIKPFDRVVVFSLPSAITKIGKFFN